MLAVICSEVASGGERSVLNNMGNRSSGRIQRAEAAGIQDSVMLRLMCFNMNPEWRLAFLVHLSFGCFPEAASKEVNYISVTRLPAH